MASMLSHDDPITESVPPSDKRHCDFMPDIHGLEPANFAPDPATQADPLLTLDSLFKSLASDNSQKPLLISPKSRFTKPLEYERYDAQTLDRFIECGIRKYLEQDILGHAVRLPSPPSFIFNAKSSLI